jgi:hypothetical protein
VEGYVLGLAAFDLVLRRINARVMGIAFHVEVAPMHTHNRPRDVSCLGVPTYPVADFKLVGHNDPAPLTRGPV